MTARIKTKQKTRVERRCHRDGAIIPPGSFVYTATPGFRGRKLYWCKDHHPRRSELTTSGPLSTYYAAIEALEDAQAGWDHEDAEFLRSALEEAASTVREAVEEWESSLENMGDGLSQGSTGQLIQERIDYANEFADACDQAQIDDFYETPEVNGSELTAEELEYQKTTWSEEQMDAINEVLSSDSL